MFLHQITAVVHHLAKRAFPALDIHSRIRLFNAIVRVMSFESIEKKKVDYCSKAKGINGNLNDI